MAISPAFWLSIVTLVFSVLVVLSLLWYTFKTGISPMPSSARFRGVIAAVLKKTGKEPVIDLGSGWGGLVVDVAARYPERRVIGYELSPVPWFVSVVRKKLRRLPNLVLYRRNFLEEELPAGTILICYLFGGGMERLERKLVTKMLSSPDSKCPLPAYLVLSNTFAFPRIKPDQVYKLNDMYNTPVYLYKITSTHFTLLEI
ncbi:MAG: class I SAM-dependent methyltransferase [Spirochaetales bacterium]|nr:class I SAM-dependent methyltransferase [Spirochaetales bacterium]